jgi:hypothetical protein
LLILIQLQAQRDEDERSASKQRKLDVMFESTTPLPSDNPRAVQITSAITKMMALDFQPYSLVENRGFRELLHLLEPRYQIPSRTTFSRKHVPDLYKKVEKTVKGTLTSDLVQESSGSGSGKLCCYPQTQYPAPAFTFTTDIWTSRSMDPYISFTVSYITDDF